MRLPLIAIAFAIGAAVSTPSLASEALPPAVAQQLDRQAVEFTMTAAKERRLMMMQETMRQQQRDQRGRGYGRDRGGYGRDGGGYGRDGGGYGRGRGDYGRPAYSRGRDYDRPGYRDRRY